MASSFTSAFILSFVFEGVVYQESMPLDLGKRDDAVVHAINARAGLAHNPARVVVSLEDAKGLVHPFDVQAGVLYKVALVPLAPAACVSTVTPVSTRRPLSPSERASYVPGAPLKLRAANPV